jgi:hypothetical protein
MITIYDTLRRFTDNIQKVNALQFNARCHLFIQTFGEEIGIEYAERMDKYGLWFAIEKLETSDVPRFFDMVLKFEPATN